MRQGFEPRLPSIASSPFSHLVNRPTATSPCLVNRSAKDSTAFLLVIGPITSLSFLLHLVNRSTIASSPQIPSFFLLVIGPITSLSLLHLVNRSTITSSPLSRLVNRPTINLLPSLCPVVTDEVDWALNINLLFPTSVVNKTYDGFPLISPNFANRPLMSHLQQTYDESKIVQSCLY